MHRKYSKLRLSEVLRKLKETHQELYLYSLHNRSDLQQPVPGVVGDSSLKCGGHVVLILPGSVDGQVAHVRYLGEAATLDVAS